MAEIERAIQPIDLDGLALMVEIHCENAKPEWKTKMIKKEISEAIKSALNFYFKYKDSPTDFIRDNGDIEMWHEETETVENGKIITTKKKKAMVSDFAKLEGGDEFDALELCKYSDWLLWYSFREVIE